VTTQAPWNYGLLEEQVRNLPAHFQVELDGELASNPWSLENAPVRILGEGIRIPDWQVYNGSAGETPWGPQPRPRDGTVEGLTLVPYGCTTLRISGFPTLW
jgi:hypothetical protein